MRCSALTLISGRRRCAGLPSPSRAPAEPESACSERVCGSQRHCWFLSARYPRFAGGRLLFCSISGLSSSLDIVALMKPDRPPRCAAPIATALMWSTPLLPGSPRLIALAHRIHAQIVGLALRLRLALLPDRDCRGRCLDGVPAQLEVALAAAEVIQRSNGDSCSRMRCVAGPHKVSSLRLRWPAIRCRLACSARRSCADGRRAGWASPLHAEWAFYAVSFSCSNSLLLARCIRTAASVSLRAPAMRFSVSTLIPGRRYCAGLSSASRVSSGV
jgi:hypothetical protein